VLNHGKKTLIAFARNNDTVRFYTLR
jgi:hypothetical protein